MTTRERILGWVAVLGQVVLIVALVAVPRRRSVADIWPPDGWIIVGFLVCASGIVVCLLSFISLGSALTATPLPKEGAALRTTGIYSIVRHPIYLGILITAAGFIIAIGTWWTALLWVVLYEFLTIKSTWEDRLLAERHQQAWVDWAEHTPAIRPRLRR
jgi:protein-S-isoprenylcysteine O-methyltransferase Ste14